MCRCADNRGLTVTSRDSEFKKPYRGVATPSWSVSERSLLHAVATQPPGQFALRSVATHGDASTLTYNRVQLTTLDRVPWRTDISPALDGGSFEHFKTSVRLPPLMLPSDARRHSPTVVSAFSGAQLRSFTVFEPPLSANKNRQCVPGNSGFSENTRSMVGSLNVGTMLISSVQHWSPEANGMKLWVDTTLLPFKLQYHFLSSNKTQPIEWPGCYRKRQHWGGFTRI